jgi:hypothetical protein
MYGEYGRLGEALDRCLAQRPERTPYIAQPVVLLPVCHQYASRARPVTRLRQQPRYHCSGVTSASPRSVSRATTVRTPAARRAETSPAPRATTCPSGGRWARGSTGQRAGPAAAPDRPCLSSERRDGLQDAPEQVWAGRRGGRLLTQALPPRAHVASTNRSCPPDIKPDGRPLCDVPAQGVQLADTPQPETWSLPPEAGQTVLCVAAGLVNGVAGMASRLAARDAPNPETT